VGFLTGLSADELEVRRETALLHALAFVAGFSAIFIALGASASASGLLLHWQVWIGRIGGVVVILFGLYLLRVIQPAFLTRERRLQLANKHSATGIRLRRVTFGAAWTPCIGPYSAILTMAAAQGAWGGVPDCYGVRARPCRAVPARRSGPGPLPGLVPAVPALPRLG